MANTSISLDEVATFPRPGTGIPSSFAFIGDEHVCYLFSDDGSLVRGLYTHNLQSGVRRVLVSPADGGDTEKNLSAEEKLERERRRERGLGVTKYSWSSENEVLLVPLGGDLYIQKDLSGTLRKLVDGSGTALLSPLLSSDGSKLAFVRDNDIYTVSTDAESNAEPTQLTRGGQANRVHGLAEYIAQEEMDRYAGFWWSGDGQYIAYTEVDETHLPAYRIMHQGSDDTGASAQEDHGYPFAGQANAKVRLGVIPASGGDTIWMDLGTSEDLYLARVHWMPDGQLWAEIENREQTQLDLVRFDLTNGKQQMVLQEESDVWINLHKSFHPLQDGGFIWSSERSGFKHLYHYDSSGSLVQQVTEGQWPVDELVAVDEDKRQLFYLSGGEDPTQTQLYRVGLDGQNLCPVTSELGTHSVIINKMLSRFIDIHHSCQHAPTVTVRDLYSGEVIQSIFTKEDPKVAALALHPPKLITLPSRDGTLLHGAIYRPPSQFKAPYPTVISVYGGPHAQRVSDSWDLSVDMRAQYLCNQGYLVFKLDNRGSARRGLAFEGAINRDMGRIEILDQVDGVNWLVENQLADSRRVAMYGWSYGGYMSAMALARAPETFHVAIAGAPVTHWDGYDTHYTERYMGTPESNPKGYENSSVMHHLHAMEGKLMLVHGLIDENVHFRHSARLINALIDAQKDYELLLFPNERHMPRSHKDRVYMETRMLRFLDKNLLPKHDG